MSDGMVSTGPLTSLAPPASVATYDLGAWFYDWVVGSRVYHQVMWGMAPSEHTDFARRALEHSIEGATLDAGCGSLLFTAPCYRESSRRLTLLDASSGMLARARRRLGSHEAEWVQGDLRALPFEAEHFANVLHFGVLHCIFETARVLGELARVTRPGGKLFLSCLVLGRSRGDAFLRRLERAGHVAEPRRAERYLEAIAQAGFTLGIQRRRGSFLFPHLRRVARAHHAPARLLGGWRATLASKHAADPRGHGQAGVPAGPLDAGLVALALTHAVYTLGTLTSLWNAPWSVDVTRYAAYVWTVILVLRIVGDFRFIGLFKRVRKTAFARADDWVFTPACATIGVGFVLALQRWS